MGYVLRCDRFLYVARGVMSFFTSKQEQDIFLKTLYLDGIRYARRKYFRQSFLSSEQTFNGDDVVGNAYIYVYQKFLEGKFENQNHFRAWFFLSIRSHFLKYWKAYSRNVSINSPLPRTDGFLTIEDFIASKISNPYLEEDDSTKKVNKALQSLTSDERRVVIAVYINKENIEDLKGKKRYLERCLRQGKLKLSRRLLQI